MSTRRKFNFPLATLTRSAELLQAALTDEAHQAAMAARLGADFNATFQAKLTAITGESTAQSGKIGDLSTLTRQQQADFAEMERLASAARRTARLAFAGQATVLSAEFQVGAAASKSLSATIARARLTHAAAVKHAAALQSQGWIPADSAALQTAITALDAVDSDQEETEDEKKGLTNEKTIAANALYATCLTIQNAARLQYPAKVDAAGNAQNITERARFLLDEFPPRDREEPEDDEDDTQAPAAPPAP